MNQVSPHLRELGVNDELLSPSEKDSLDRYGYLNLGPILTTEQVEQIRLRIQELMTIEGDEAGSELMESPHIKHPKEAGADRLADLVNKGPEFDVFYTHPRVLAAISYVLGNDLKLSSLNYRAAKPGHGEQNLHVDWKEAVDKYDYRVCNSIWLLDDFHEENGATRVVPGTHLSGLLPDDVMENPTDRHPDEVLIEGKAGEVVIFNSHTWHGGTKNLTSSPRRAIHSYFCRRDMPQQIDQKRYIQPETRARIGPAGLHILDI